MELLSYCLALLIGVSLGLTGGGGSILTVPVLVYVAGIEPIISTAYSLFIVGGTSLVGGLIYLRKGLVNVQTAIAFAVPSFITVWLMRKFVLHAIPADLFTIGGFVFTKNLFLMLFFALIMVIAGVKMVRGAKVEDKHVDEPVNYLKVAFNGIVVGILSGLVGAGGGFLIVPALVMLMHLPMRQAVGTSLLIIAINSLIGFTGDLFHLEAINWSYLLIFTAIASVGVYAGIYISRFIDGKQLKKLFGWFVVSMAVFILAKEVCPILMHSVKK